MRNVPVLSPADTRAVKVTTLIDVTGDVVIVKNTSVAPAGTVTVLGHVVKGELSKIETTLPPGPATPLRTTRHVVEFPPVT